MEKEYNVLTNNCQIFAKRLLAAITSDSTPHELHDTFE